MRGQSLLRLAIGAIAVMALIWFIASFFMLGDENPRSALEGAHYALAAMGRAA